MIVKMLQSTSILSLIFAANIVIGVQLPSLAGRYPVGTVSLELIDHSRLDPLAPSPQPRDLMASIYYPTSESAVKSSNYTFAAYITPTTAAALSMNIGTSPEILSVTTQSYLGAPIRNNDFPVLIFSPGFGGSRIMYTTLLENLASQGWVIIAVDHTYDSVVVEFPDGRNVSWLPSLLDNFPSQMAGEIELRGADVEFVASAFRNSTILSKLPGLTNSDGSVNSLRSNKIGIFGHSLGGATAAQAVSNSTTFICGTNIDGGIYGPIATLGTNKPFMQIEAADHNVYDTTTAEFYKHLTGFRREFAVNGTVHLSFTDFPVLRGLLGEAVIPETASNLTQFGTINGERLVEIDTALIDGFFAFCLKDKSSDELDSLAQRYREISVPVD
jgi:dienelactone hydrolase